jgi:alpha-L-fucosidase
LGEIGRLWKNDAPAVVLPPTEAPVISSNIAKHRPAKSSWSDDMNIMDFGNDDNFGTAWQSNPAVKEPWYEVDFAKEQSFNMIVLTGDNISGYRLEYRSNGVWKPLLSGDKPGRVKLHRFATVWGDGVRMLMDRFTEPPAIAEFGVYEERR